MTATDSRADRGYGVPHRVRAAELRSGNDPLVFPDSQRSSEAHRPLAVGDPNSHPAMTCSQPRKRAPGGSQTNRDHAALDTHAGSVAVARPPMGISEPTSTPADGADFSNDQGIDVHQRAPVVVDGQDRTHSVRGAHRPVGPILADPLLALAADVLDDLQRVRIANENRLRQLTRDETDADGLDRGFGLTLDHPDVKRLAALVDALGKAEHDAELNLKRLMRKHPLGAWVKNIRGVGEQLAARLLASVGDPYWNDLHDRPRTVSELWAFCGYKPGQRRKRGEKSNWSNNAKKYTFLLAESAKRQLVKPCHVVQGDAGEYLHAVHVDGCACSPYRVEYDRGRARYAGSLHPEPCVRCGPAGSPAAAGSERSKAHQDQMAIRLASKAILKDLWREAKRLHEHPDGQTRVDVHHSDAVGAPTSSGHNAHEAHLFAAAGSTSEVQP